jgi:hypothetical protein
MSGFRKFRSTLHRRRRSIEAVELGFLGSAPASDEAPLGTDLAGVVPALGGPVPDSESVPLDFSPSEEAMEIGPAPIAWMKPRKDSDN